LKCLGQIEGASFEDVAAVPLWDMLSLAVQAIVDWLSTGDTVGDSVRSRIDSLGSVAGKQLTSTPVDRGDAASAVAGDRAPSKEVVEQLSVALFTKLNFWWSDKTCAVLAEEAGRLGIGRGILEEATSNVVKNCKVSLVRMAKQYDAEMAGLHGELRHQALHDALTGLPNRALILDRIGQMLARGRRQFGPVAVLFLDLDNFKDINDTLGHRAGDELLRAVGVRLASAIREADTAGRLGGDEFVVLTVDALLELARSLSDAAHQFGYLGAAEQYQDEDSDNYYGGRVVIESQCVHGNHLQSENEHRTVAHIVVRQN